MNTKSYPLRIKVLSLIVIMIIELNIIPININVNMSVNNEAFNNLTVLAIPIIDHPICTVIVSTTPDNSFVIDV